MSEPEKKNQLDIQLYTEKVIIESEQDVSNVTLTNIDLAHLVSQINVDELLQAINDNDQYGSIVDFVTRAQREARDEE